MGWNRSAGGLELHRVIVNVIVGAVLYAQSSMFERSGPWLDDVHGSSKLSTVGSSFRPP